MTCWPSARIGQMEMQKTEVNLDQLVAGDVGRFSGETRGARHRLGNPPAAAGAGRPCLAAHGAGQSDLQCGEVHRHPRRGQNRNRLRSRRRRRDSDLHSRQRRRFRSAVCRQTYSACFNACTARKSLRARASGWPTSSASFSVTAAGSGRKAWWMAARHFIFRLPRSPPRTAYFTVGLSSAFRSPSAY